MSLLAVFLLCAAPPTDAPATPPGSNEGRIFAPEDLAAAAQESHRVPEQISVAERYAKGSVSMAGSALLSVGLVNTGSGTTTGTSFSLGWGLRWVSTSGFTLQPALEVGIVSASGGGVLSGGTATAVAPGISLGFAYAAGENVAFTPMVGYQLALISGSGNLTSHAAQVILPMTVFIGRRAFVELYASGGIEVGAGSTSGAVPLFALGQRIGFML